MKEEMGFKEFTGYALPATLSKNNEHIPETNRARGSGLIPSLPLPREHKGSAGHRGMCGRVQSSPLGPECSRLNPISPDYSKSLGVKTKHSAGPAWLST